MKYLVNHIIGLILTITVLSACQQEDVRYSLETPPDTMTLSTSAEDLVLDKDSKSETAISFTWKKAANRGGETKLRYYFKIDIADNNFETAIDKIEIPESVTTISFSHEELNNMLIGWRVTPGQEVRLQAEIIAEVLNSKTYMKPEISTVEFNVTGYYVEPALEVANVWICGGATPTGWNTPFTQKLTAQGNGVFIWNGILTEGELKFPLSGSQGFECDYLMPANVGGNDLAPLTQTAVKYVAYSKNNMPDLKWEVTANQEGYYRITLDTKAMTVSFEKTGSIDIPDDVPYKKIWICGDATPDGWNSPFAQKLTYDPTAAKGTFVWTGDLAAGEFKFPLDDNSAGTWSLNYLMPKNADGNNLATLAETNVIFVATGGPDKKWKVAATETGTYKISLNVISMTIQFEKQ